MSDEPTFPKEAAVGADAASVPASPSTAEAPAGDPDQGKLPDPRRKKYVAAGVAAGIGSAAIVAALLYANRGKKGDKDKG